MEGWLSAEKGEGAGRAQRKMELLRGRIWCMVCGMGLASVGEEAIGRLVVEAFEATDKNMGEAEARRWGGDFRFPSSTVEQDEADLARLGFDIGALARERQERLAGDRLSVERAMRLSPDNPERDKVARLAAGMPVVRAADFVSNGHGRPVPEMKASYRKTACAVNRCFQESYFAQGLGLLLSADIVRRHCPTVHLSVAGWAPKFGKPQGRPLTDMTSGVAQGSSALNSAEAKLMSDELWGVIVLPTVVGFVQQIVALQATMAPEEWPMLRLWATDVAGAFTKLNFRPEDVPLVAVMLTHGLVALFLAGVFGWSGTPAAFAVITRALLWEFRRRLTGAMDMYVDDAYGVCLASEVADNLLQVEEVVCDLLGPGALESSKTRTGRALDVLGYRVDLDTQRLGIAHKNVLRALYGFFLLDEKPGMIRVSTLERLASWASRYGLTCQNMRPWTHRLYAAYQGRRRTASVPLTQELTMICRFFQVLLVLSVVHPLRFSRPFASLVGAMGPPRCVVEFDASLTGGGGLIFASDVNGGETLIGGFIVDLRLLKFGEDAEFQNSAEFTTLTVGVIVAHLAGLDVRSLMTRGDSVTALSWAAAEHFRGTRVSRAASVYILASQIFEIGNMVTVHLPKEVNTRADDLSRGVSWEGAQAKYPELRGYPLLGISEEVGRLVELSDPRRESRGEGDFAKDWGEIARILLEGARHLPPLGVPDD